MGLWGNPGKAKPFLTAPSLCSSPCGLPAPSQAWASRRSVGGEGRWDHTQPGSLSPQGRWRVRLCDTAGLSAWAVAQGTV